MTNTRIQRFPLKLEAPMPDESLVGFISRFAQRNGLEQPSTVASAAGIGFAETHYGDDEIEKLAGVTGQSFTELRRLAPTLPRETVLGQVADLYGQTVTKGSIVHFGARDNRAKLSSPGRRVCPTCLAESPHHRVTWTLRFARACTSHGRRLIDTCSVCNEKLTWNVAAPNLCRCGADLSARTISEPVTPGELRGPTILLECFWGRSEIDRPLLSGLRFSQIFVAAEKLGIFGADLDDRYWLDDQLRADVGQWLTRGTNLLSVSPDDLGDRLEKMARKRLGRPTLRYMDPISDLHGKLEATGAEKAPLTLALREFLGRY